MKSITFECEVITPMFLAGADGRTPEIRPPSIKGVMRFWWRAMNGHLSLEELKKKEAEIFGGSGENEGRSKVIIRIERPLKYDGRCRYNPVPHKKFQLPAFSPTLKYSIVLILKRDVVNNNLTIFDIEKLNNLFILTSILGGLGKRVRRGFGSFRISKINNNPYNTEYTLENILDLINSVGSNMYMIDTKNDERRIKLDKSLNAQYPFLEEIQLGKECDSWENLLAKIGEASHKHDIDSLGFAHGKKRFSSPIYVSVLKNSNGKYFPVISNLNTVFENNRKIDFKGQNEFKGAIL